MAMGLPTGFVLLTLHQIQEVTSTDQERNCHDKEGGAKTAQQRMWFNTPNPCARGENTAKQARCDPAAEAARCA